jgi:pimeloyl-ACP methyl ester carboxylesterase
MKRAGLIGGALGLLAAGAAVGLATERYAIGRIRSGTDPVAGEPFGRLEPDRGRVIVADDGVPLYVEEVGRIDAPLTVVFVHGYGLQMGSWHFQRQALAGPDRRLIFFDQRCHGRSGRGDAVNSTVDQLGRDLAVLLSDLDGPVVLVGHSLGGMTIMALADQEPELFGTTVRGVALLSTAAGRVSELKLTLPAALAALRGPLIPVVARGMTHRPALLERGRRAVSDIAWVLTRRYSFGTKDVSPALVGYVEKMIAATPVDVIGEFLPVIMSHDKKTALPALRKVPVLVMVGEKDLLTPASHSRAIAAELPDAQLEELPGAGHLALMQCADATNAALTTLLEDVLSE